ncbi:hypothetical protein H0H93_006639 [Arthromyces matolae]|nr:hypothetical protein H0H93_006639 [Arthromyces matolae]
MVLLLFPTLNEALQLFPPASPVYLGTTVRVSWTSSPQDPPYFNLYFQCQNLPVTPKINATTADSEMFIGLPSGFNIGVSVLCFVEAKINGHIEFLAQSSNFTVFFEDSPSLSSTSTMVTSGASNPSITPPSSTTSTGSSISLISILINTGVKSVTVPLSTISSSASSESTSISVASQPSQTSISRKASVGAIVGGVIAGSVAFISSIILLLAYWRSRWRKRQANNGLLDPLPYDEERESSVPTSNLQSIPEEETIHTVSINDQENVRETEDQLRQMVQQMSERISALEAQHQRNELVDSDLPSDLPPQDNDTQAGPPPMYSAPGAEVDDLAVHTEDPDNPQIGMAH